MSSRSFVLSFACLLLAAGSSHAQDADLARHVDIKKLKKHVTYLASPELEGRRDGVGIEKARVYLVDLFKQAGLQPKGTPGNGYMQAFGSKGLGRNIIGFLPGHDPRLKHEIVLVSAHYDHVGKRGKLIFPGANDNASGVAAMLEIMRVLHEQKVKLKRSLLFVSFDQEERWLIGSTHFVAKPTVPLKDITICINADMLGRNLADVIRGTVFVLGAEHSPSLQPVVKTAARGLKIKAALIGTDLIGVRGDYGPFAARNIPYLFFSNGEHSSYHQPTDTADRIIYPKLLASTRLMLRTVVGTANLPTRPTFQKPTPSVDEAKAFLGVIDQLIPQAKLFGVKGIDMEVMRFLRALAQHVIKTNRITVDQRQILKLGVQGMFVGLRRILSGVLRPR